jgi:hypothetical protein
MESMATCAEENALKQRNERACSAVSLPIFILIRPTNCAPLQHTTDTTRACLRRNRNQDLASESSLTRDLATVQLPSIET